MPDVVLKDASGEAQTYEGVEAVEVPTSDGGIAVFHSEEALTADKIKVTNEKVEATNVDAAITELAEKIGQGGGGTGEGASGPVDAANVTYTPDTSGTWYGNIYGSDELTVAAALNLIPDKCASLKSMWDLEELLLGFQDSGVDPIPLTEVDSMSAIPTGTTAIYRVKSASTYEGTNDAGESVVYDVPAGNLWVALENVNDGAPTPLLSYLAADVLARAFFCRAAYLGLLGGTMQKGGIPAESIVLNPPVGNQWNVRSAIEALQQSGGGTSAEIIDDLNFRIAMLEGRVEEILFASGTLADMTAGVSIANSVPLPGERVEASLNGTEAIFVAKSGLPADLEAMMSDAEKAAYASLTDTIFIGNFSEYGFYSVVFTATDAFIQAGIQIGLIPEGLPAGTCIMMHMMQDYDKIYALFGYSADIIPSPNDPYTASVLRVTDTASPVPASKIAFDTANHPELTGVLPADPTMQDVLDYLLTQKEATT